MGVDTHIFEGRWEGKFQGIQSTFQGMQRIDHVVVQIRRQEVPPATGYTYIVYSLLAV